MDLKTGTCKFAREGEKGVKSQSTTLQSNFLLQYLCLCPKPNAPIKQRSVCGHPIPGVSEGVFSESVWAVHFQGSVQVYILLDSTAYLGKSSQNYPGGRGSFTHFFLNHRVHQCWKRVSVCLFYIFSGCDCFLEFSYSKSENKANEYPHKLNTN